MRKTRTNQPKSPSAEELDLILKAVDELRSRQVAKESLLEFARYAVPGYQCSRMHLELADRLQRVESGEIKRLMVNAPRRHGKQLADSTPMLTANRGWTTHGELRWGDYVFGLDGKPVRVLAVSQPSEQDWEVEFSNGATLQAHAAHEWQLRSRPCGRNIVVETQWLAGINRNGNRRVLIQERHGLFLLPKRAALEYPQQSLPLHPYVLGVWLGDGRTTKPDICYSRKDAAVFHKLVHLCGQPSWQATHKTTGVEYAGWKTWREPLWSLGLLRKSPKRIPRQYLQGSVTQRMDLLAGLLDTDGHTDAGGCRVRIATVSDGLRDDIMELVRGLGMEPHCYTQAAALSSSGIQGRRPVHYIGFSCLVRPPLALERKQPSIVNAKGKTVSVRAVRKVPPVIGRCIQVDAADGLYLAGKELLPTHNSLMVSQIFPCWLMGRRPLIRVVQCGYAESLTVSHSRKARDLFATERFHNVFPSVTHRPGTEGQRSVAISRQTAHEWGTEDGGSYYAVGVGGGLAGRGFHCLTGDAVVQTECGPTQLQHLQTQPLSSKVLAYDIAAGRPVWRSIKAISCREAIGLYRITTAKGRVVKATAEHPFWVGGEWKTANKLANGDCLLLAVPEAVCDEPASLAENAAVWKPQLEKGQDRQVAGVANPERLSQDPAFDCGEGRRAVCGLRQYAEPSGASFGHEPSQQHMGQPCNLVQDMPHAMARGGAFKTEADTVALVEPIRGRALVWNLQVDGEENYFANGILTHNCGIIDDFYKSRSEANSITVRDKVHDWYRSVFYPAQDEDEIFPGAAIIVTATRWHVSDLTAQILRAATGGDDEAQEDWVQLSHKAIDEDGQALWPARWPVEKLMRIKAAIGSAEFSAQYQQSPRDAEGGVFRREWFDGKYLDSMPQVRGGKWCRFWDLAGTEQSAKSSDPDWTVGCLGLMHEGIFYLCHMRRFRATELTIQAAVRECAQSDPPGTRIRIEQEPGSGSKNLIANYTRMLVGYDVRGVPSQKDKVVRAAALSAYSEAGNVRLVRGAWNETFLSEAETMPTGEHDDTCWVAGTKVITPHGERSIESICAGDIVLGASGWVTVLRSMRNGTKRVVAVGKNTGTPNHPVWTSNGWMPLANILGNSIVAVCNATTAMKELPHARAYACDATSSARGAPLAPSRNYISNRASTPAAQWAGRLFAGFASSITPDSSGTEAQVSYWPRQGGLCRWSAWNLTALRSGDTQPPRSLSTVGITSRAGNGLNVGYKLCTKRFGRLRMAQFQKAMIFTTEMETLGTIGWKTSPAFPKRSMCGSICLASRLLQEWPGISKASGHWPRYGISLRKAGNGIAITPKELQPQEVYNLTTSDGTYFANGMLTHNCDSATGCFNELSTGGGKAQVEGFERPGASRPFSRASGVWG